MSKFSAEQAGDYQYSISPESAKPQTGDLRYPALLKSLNRLLLAINLFEARRNRQLVKRLEQVSTGIQQSLAIMEKAKRDCDLP